MCGCSKAINAPQNQRIKQAINQENCTPQSWYTDLLASADQLPIESKSSNLKSFIKSALNTYSRDCHVFKKPIEKLAQELNLL